MQALGLIETKGLLAAVESADAMLKAAEVTLLEKTYVGGGLVSIAVTGGVAAVKAAVEAGAAAVKQIDGSLLFSEHVIPRPHEELDALILPITPHEITKDKVVEAIIAENTASENAATENAATENTATENTTTENTVTEDTVTEDISTENTVMEEKVATTINLNLNEIRKEDIDKIVLEYGLDKAIEILNSLKVTKLRNLAREYKNLKIAGRMISKADKKRLLTELSNYYGKN